MTSYESATFSLGEFQSPSADPNSVGWSMCRCRAPSCRVGERNNRTFLRSQNYAAGRTDRPIRYLEGETVKVLRRQVLQALAAQLRYVAANLPPSVHGKPSHPKWSPFLPKAILVADLPVPKHSKVQLREVTINNGIHWHGLMLTNPFAPKLQEPPDVHIKKNLSKYLVGSIRQIDVQPITHDPEYVTGYGLKSLKSRFSTDEIVIFPRSVSELPSRRAPGKGPVRAPGERPTYDFQRT